MAVDYKVLMKGDAKDLLEALKASDKALAESMKQVAKLDKKLKDLERQMKDAKNAAKNFDAVKKAISESVPAADSLFSTLTKFTSITGGLSLVAGGLAGIGKAAFEAGQNSDWLMNRLNAAKAAFGSFAGNLLRGTPIPKDLFSSYTELEELKDEFADLTRAQDAARASAERAAAVYKEISGRKDASPKDIAGAKEDLDLAEKNSDKIDSEVKASIEAQFKAVAKAIGVSNRSKEQIYDMILNAHESDRIYPKEMERTAPLREHEAKTRELLTQYPQASQAILAMPKPKIPESPYSKLERENAIAMQNLNDDQRDYFVNLFKREEDLTANRANLLNRENRIDNKLDKKSEKKEKEVFPAGSPGYIKEEIDKTQKEIDRTPDITKSVELRIKKEEFEKQLKDFEKKPPVGSPAYIKEEIDKTQKEIDTEKDLEKSVELRIKKEEFEKQLQDIEDEARKNINLRFQAGIFLTEKEMLIEQIRAIEKQIKDTMPLELRVKLTREKQGLEKQIDRLDDDEKEREKKGEKIKENQKKGSTFRGAQELIKEYGSDKIEAYANPFLEVTNGALDLTSALAAFTDEGSQTAQVIGAVTQGIGQMASQIPQLIASITALTSKETVEAGAEAAGAIASGAKSASKIPIVGGILAVAQAVALAATLFSTMSQAKKFAVGGIVPGNSFAGDKILSRLNSGEMVLNQGQQNRLFSMINSGASGNGNGGRDNVQFVLRGTDLIGLINNTQRKRSL